MLHFTVTHLTHGALAERLLRTAVRGCDVLNGTVVVWLYRRQGDTGMFITDEGRVNRFARRYGDLAIGKIDKGAKDAEKVAE